MKFATNASNSNVNERIYRMKMLQKFEKKFKNENRYCEIKTILFINLFRNVRNQQIIIMYEFSSRHTNDKINKISMSKKKIKFNIENFYFDMRHFNAIFD